MRQSPWYEQILQEGRQEGIQAGQKELTLRQLNRKLGSLDPTLQNQIQDLPLTLLEQLAEDLLDFRSLTDLIQGLESHSA